MIALMLALCGALPDSVDAASPFVPVPTAVVPFEGAPQTSGLASGSDSAGAAALAPRFPLVPPPVPTAGLDSNGGHSLAPGGTPKRESGVKERHPFVLGAAGAVGGGFVGGILGATIMKDGKRDEIVPSNLIGAIYGVWIGSAIGATWGVVHERAPEKAGRTVLVPLLGGTFGTALGLFMGASTGSLPIGFLIMASASSLGAMFFDATGHATPKPTSTFVPILEPQRTGLVLHTRF